MCQEFAGHAKRGAASSWEAEYWSTPFSSADPREPEPRDPRPSAARPRRRARDLEGANGGLKEWGSLVTTGLIVFRLSFCLHVQTLTLTDAQTPFLGTPLVPLKERNLVSIFVKGRLENRLLEATATSTRIERGGGRGSPAPCRSALSALSGRSRSGFSKRRSARS